MSFQLESKDSKRELRSQLCACSPTTAKKHYYLTARPPFNVSLSFFLCVSLEVNSDWKAFECKKKKKNPQEKYNEAHNTIGH